MSTYSQYQSNQYSSSKYTGKNSNNNSNIHTHES